MNPGVMRWPSSRRLVAGYTLAFGLLIVNTIVTFWNLRTIAVDSRDVARTHEVLVGLDAVLSNLRDAESGERGYLLTGDERYLDQYRRARSLVARSLANLEVLALTDGFRQDQVARVKDSTKARIAELEQATQVRKGQRSAADVDIVRSNRGIELMSELLERIDGLKADENDRRDLRRAIFHGAIGRTVFTYSSVSVLALTLLFIVHYLNQRRGTEVRTSARWLSTTLASIGDAVIATDEAGRVIFMNQTAEQLTGWAQSEALGMDLGAIFRLVNEQTGEPIESPVATVLREGLVVGLANHRVLLTKDRTPRPINDCAAPIKDDEGKVRGVVLVFHDVTEQRESERERELLNRELQEKDKRKDEFLAMLAHELRNPLAAIDNAIGLSIGSGLTEDIEWSLEVVDRQVRKLSRLIDDLLDVSRITRGKIELRRELIDAATVVESAIETARPLIEERRHRLELAIEHEDLWIDADPTRIEQVLVNLLNNAAKYSEDGGCIGISASRDGESVVITVRDFGVGIPPGQLPRMFELFTQGDRSLARSDSGLGIGLTVVKKLVELHGGSVAARSEGPGMGSEFTVRLPAAERPAEIRSVPVPGQIPGPRRPSRILVVDDNIDTAVGMTRLLEREGHEVQTAYNGAEALRVAKVQCPEFVLLDIGLPEMDGYEVARRLRQEEGCQHAVIVGVSGYGPEWDQNGQGSTGFDHHLVKPVDQNALMSILSGN